ncbi:MAG: hypothetical protein ACP5LD_08020 [Desulfomonilaceae bacterium]
MNTKHIVVSDCEWNVHRCVRPIRLVARGTIPYAKSRLIRVIASWESIESNQTALFRETYYGSMNASPAEGRIPVFGRPANYRPYGISVSGHPTAEIIFFGPNFNAWPGILTCDSLVKTFYYMSKEFFSDRHGKNPPFFFFFVFCLFRCIAVEKGFKEITIDSKE